MIVQMCTINISKSAPAVVVIVTHRNRIINTLLRKFAKYYIILTRPDRADSSNRYKNDKNVTRVLG